MHAVVLKHGRDNDVRILCRYCTHARTYVRRLAAPGTTCLLFRDHRDMSVFVFVSFFFRRLLSVSCLLAIY